MTPLGRVADGLWHVYRMNEEKQDPMFCISLDVIVKVTNGEHISLLCPTDLQSPGFLWFEVAITKHGGEVRTGKSTFAKT